MVYLTRRATSGNSKSGRMVDLSRRVTEDSESKPQFWMRMKSINCAIKSSKKTNRGETWTYWRMPNQKTNLSKTSESFRMPKLQTNVSKITQWLSRLCIPSTTHLNAWLSLKSPRTSPDLSLIVWIHQTVTSRCSRLWCPETLSSLITSKELSTLHHAFITNIS